MKVSAIIFSHNSPIHWFGMVAAICCVLCTQSVGAQTSATAVKNNPYSPSPSAMDPIVPLRESSVKQVPEQIASVDREPGRITDRYVKKQFNYEPLTSSKPSVSPTEMYLIGKGDVLIIDLKNSPNAKGKYVVSPDGTIDYPLAGENITVAGRSAEEVAAILASSIKLFAQPKVDVKIAEYASHIVMITGLAENTGEINMMREAMPLFAICASAILRPEAKMAVIKRAETGKTETYDLKINETGSILIYPGDAVDFIADPVRGKL